MNLKFMNLKFMNLKFMNLKFMSPKFMSPMFLNLKLNVLFRWIYGTSVPMETHASLGR